MTDYADEIAYNRELYAKSPRERLRRINYTRKRAGRSLVTSLDQCKLRVPLSDDEKLLDITGYGSDGAPR